MVGGGGGGGGSRQCWVVVDGGGWCWVVVGGAAALRFKKLTVLQACLDIFFSKSVILFHSPSSLFV